MKERDNHFLFLFSLNSLIKVHEVYIPVMRQMIQYPMVIRKKNKFLVLFLLIGQLVLVKLLIFKQFNGMSMRWLKQFLQPMIMIAMVIFPILNSKKLPKIFHLLIPLLCLMLISRIE